MAAGEWGRVIRDAVEKRVGVGERMGRRRVSAGGREESGVREELEHVSTWSFKERENVRKIKGESV